MPDGVGCPRRGETRERPSRPPARIPVRTRSRRLPARDSSPRCSNGKAAATHCLLVSLRLDTRVAMARSHRCAAASACCERLRTRPRDARVGRAPRVLAGSEPALGSMGSRARGQAPLRGRSVQRHTRGSSRPPLRLGRRSLTRGRRRRAKPGRSVRAAHSGPRAVRWPGGRPARGADRARGHHRDGPPARRRRRNRRIEAASPSPLSTVPARGIRCPARRDNPPRGG